MNITWPSGVGAVVAIVVLILAVVLAVIGQAASPLLILGLIGALAIARLT